VSAFAASPLPRAIRSRLRRFGEIFEVMRGVDRCLNTRGTVSIASAVGNSSAVPKVLGQRALPC